MILLQMIIFILPFVITALFLPVPIIMIAGIVKLVKSRRNDEFGNKLKQEGTKMLLISSICGALYLIRFFPTIKELELYF